jgi:hypothetical protein
VARRCGSGRPWRPGRPGLSGLHGGLCLARIRLDEGDRLGVGDHRAGGHLDEAGRLFRFAGPCHLVLGRRAWRLHPCWDHEESRLRGDRRFVCLRACRAVGEAPMRLVVLTLRLNGNGDGEADGPRRYCQNPRLGIGPMPGIGQTPGTEQTRWCFRQLRRGACRSDDDDAWEGAQDRSRTRPFAPRAVQTSSPRKEMLSVWRVYLGCLGLPPATPTEKRGGRKPFELGSAPKGFQSKRRRLARSE